MKYLLPTLLLNLFVCICIAQTTAPVDTTKNNSNKKVKMKMVSGTAMYGNRDIIDNLNQSGNYSTFVSAIRTVGLTETFKSKGPITVFVPDNNAFNSLSTPAIDTLMKRSHTLELSNLLTYHAVQGIWKAKDIASLIKSNNGQATITTVAGGKLTAHIDTNRNIVLVDEYGGQSIISVFDVPQSNGMVHLVTRVLVPKNKAI